MSNTSVSQVICNNLTLIVPNDLHQILPTRERREILPLFLERPRTREGTDTSSSLQVRREFGLALVILLLLGLSLCFGGSYKVSPRSYTQPSIGTEEQRLRECPIQILHGARKNGTYPQLRPPRP